MGRVWGWFWNGVGMVLEEGCVKHVGMVWEGYGKVVERVMEGCGKGM